MEHYLYACTNTALAGTMNQYGDVLEAMGKLDQARDTFIDAHRVIKDLVGRDPDRISAQRDLAWAVTAISGRSDNPKAFPERAAPRVLK